MPTTGALALLDPSTRLPQRLRARREAAGLTQTDAAARVGVTLRTWQRWEAGETRGALGHLPAMAKALGTTPEELLGLGDATATTPRGNEELALDERLRRIEETQAAILAALQGLEGTLRDPEAVLREADALLEAERPGTSPPEDGGQGRQ